MSISVWETLPSRVWNYWGTALWFAKCCQQEEMYNNEAKMLALIRRQQPAIATPLRKYPRGSFSVLLSHLWLSHWLQQFYSNPLGGAIVSTLVSEENSHQTSVVCQPSFWRTKWDKVANNGKKDETLLNLTHHWQWLIKPTVATKKWRWAERTSYQTLKQMGHSSRRS